MSIVVIVAIRNIGMKFTKYDLCVAGMMAGIGLLALIPLLGTRYSPF